MAKESINHNYYRLNEIVSFFLDPNAGGANAETVFNNIFHGFVESYPNGKSFKRDKISRMKSGEEDFPPGFYDFFAAKENLECLVEGILNSGTHLKYVSAQVQEYTKDIETSSPKIDQLRNGPSFSTDPHGLLGARLHVLRNEIEADPVALDHARFLAKAIRLACANPVSTRGEERTDAHNLNHCIHGVSKKPFKFEGTSNHLYVDRNNYVDTLDRVMPTGEPAVAVLCGFLDNMK